jgi:hypothetical protein
VVSQHETPFIITEISVKIRYNKGNELIKEVLLMTTLDIDKSKLTIMGVQFDSQQEFKGVWYALSTNMIEGWEPEKKDVEEMKQYIIQKNK